MGKINIWKKHNTRRPDEVEFIMKDGFTRKKISKSIGSLEDALKKQMKFIDEKYEVAWDKILPKRCYDENARNKRKR